MIIKNGIDIISKKRIERIFYSKLKNNFINKILTEEEFSEFQKIFNIDRKISFLSARFSVKESISKAIGCGIQTKNLIFKDINITKDELGAPFVQKNKKIDKLILEFFNKQDYNLAISISDEKEYTISQAILYIKV